jgi:hypothetical protein
LKKQAAAAAAAANTNMVKVDLDLDLEALLKESSAAGTLFKPRLEKTPRFYMREDRPQRRGNAMGRMHKLVDLFISHDGYIYAAYLLTNDKANSDIGRVGFTRFAKLVPLPQEKKYNSS